ncbi:hypothetical protein COV20_02460 [Candidatus Woesearchaeota archaeon CG10_big_fil_rev_8_21_14_0_10_45_16]|nr:MAG: hypothetical protein COV20_02460 [Candidatus Woesearchaeota archaeon CG10_big_fil_rev_8_21_14_0_10_45_16]
MDVKKRLWYFWGSFFTVLIGFRLFLSLSPFTNLNVGGYNIHHLFIGAVLMLGTIPFLIFGRFNALTLSLTGIGSALVADELFFLILTDGSDLSYLSPISWWGAGIFSLLLLIITGGVYYHDQC